MLLGSARGGGGVFSTVDDLVAWNDALTAERLGGFVSAKLQEPARLANGRTLAPDATIAGPYVGAMVGWGWRR
jgi:hypothetical protein